MDTAKIVRGLSHPTKTRKFQKLMMFLREPRFYLRLRYMRVLDRFAAHWYDWTERNDGIQHKVYRSYAAYLSHQKSKFRKVDLMRHDREYGGRLTRRLERLDGDVVVPGKNVLCLAARLGTEVKSFQARGCFAVGTDLEPGPENEYVVHGDFHNIKFPANSVDIVFTNSLDHALHFDRLLSEMKRVLKPGGHVIADVIKGTKEGYTPGRYEAAAWERIDDVVRRFEQSGFILLRRTFIRHPWSAGGEHVVFQTG